jgi:hypothetical protein
VGLDRDGRGADTEREPGAAGASAADELPPKKVECDLGARPVLDRLYDDPMDQLRGDRSAERALGPVPYDLPEHSVRVGREVDGPPERDGTAERTLHGPEPVGSPGQDRPRGWDPAFPLRQEPVGVPERPEDRPEVRGPDPEVVEHEHGGATLATEPPQESGEDLDHRKAPPIESGVQVTQQGTGDTVGASQSGRADRQDLR